MLRQVDTVAENSPGEAPLIEFFTGDDPARKTMAAQDFRHSAQKSGECVPDFIRKLEKTYQIANGKDDLSQDTRDALLYSQLYEGQCYDLMHSRTSLQGTLHCCQGRREESGCPQSQSHVLHVL